MQFAQAIRQMSSGIRARFRSFFGGLRNVDGAQLLNWGKKIGGVLILFGLLYYPIGMLWFHQINDDIDEPLGRPDLLESQSRVVDVVAALIDREVNQTYWVDNDPFFYPSAFLDNMPNFQVGVISACARFSVQLADQLGRTRGSSPIDPDLEKANGELQYRGDRWFWDLNESWLPAQPTEGHYRVALRALRSYNERLARGDATFERRADNLLATLDRIALDVGSASADLENAIAERAIFIDTNADDVFYSVKGQMYGYLMILRALETDFAAVIEEKRLESVFDEMLSSLEQGLALDPWVVVNASPDGQLLPSHLAAQGFYLLRARTQMREITDILLK